MTRTELKRARLDHARVINGIREPAVIAPTPERSAPATVPVAAQA